MKLVESGGFMGFRGQISGRAGLGHWCISGAITEDWRREIRRAGVVLLIWVVGVFSTGAEVLYMPLNGLQLAQQRASGVDCVNHLKQILLGAQVWSMDHADQPPPDLQSLTNELQSPAVLFCPANLRTSAPTNWAQLDWSQIDYE